jgi:cyclopropane fatty-acyl-phospholipid synthase-like methyltransferase
MANSWARAEQAIEFLTRADKLPHRGEGEGVLVRDLEGALPGRILDLGCGDGRLSALLLEVYPESNAMCVDMSETMLAAAQERFASDGRVTFATHRLDDPLPFAGPFDAIVSSLAIHHVTDERKQTLYAECAALLAPGGVFANLEIVASPTRALHDRWRDEMGARDDPSDRLRDLASQLAWIDAAGLENVDCIWKWRSLALMRGERAAG